ncbi:MbtH family NRPS accessory protein [Bradyrhizobium sp. SRS-191]|uniref:MbtH family protein n=1 Tax=Bradyrhizobium sp. SRS-191 TaxID=2962606 RepID=UPI00211E35A5|nr:MbtH family NRPS accessory protein [Bradyrhizobium sp. SRS-191]
MDSDDVNSDRLYYVVVNSEEQYSIWRADRDPPKGWSIVGEKAAKPQCLDYINSVWTDMRPLSLRRQMAAAKH